MKPISKRKYKVYNFEFKKVIPLERLFINKENDFEYIYALQDIIDDILDLKVNESLFVQMDRGDVRDKGVIIRIS